MFVKLQRSSRVSPVYFMSKFRLNLIQGTTVIKNPRIFSGLRAHNHQGERWHGSCEWESDYHLPRETSWSWNMVKLAKIKTHWERSLPDAKMVIGDKWRGLVLGGVRGDECSHVGEHDDRASHEEEAGPPSEMKCLYKMDNWSITDLFQSASVWVPDIFLIWVMLDCLSRRRAELLNTDMMMISENTAGS